ncbi:hypothetical protein Naga_100857g2 [Nannochloropsis gaditana]|uniref:Uncharacterized protein n=1 Tax=Nannochloropsis gaditana TaxID=72520 RepID=W7TSQ2_9STRA|nr:hypothetical protein Naga_100857g2 [Nannochloropsis gaditana]
MLPVPDHIAFHQPQIPLLTSNQSSYLLLHRLYSLLAISPPPSFNTSTHRVAYICMKRFPNHKLSSHSFPPFSCTPFGIFSPFPS